MSDDIEFTPKDDELDFQEKKASPKAVGTKGARQLAYEGEDPGTLSSVANGVTDMIPGGRKISSGLAAVIARLRGDSGDFGQAQKEAQASGDLSLQRSEKTRPTETSAGKALGFGATLAVPAGAGGAAASMAAGGVYGGLDAYGRSNANSELEQVGDVAGGIGTGILTAGAAHGIAQGASSGYGALKNKLSGFESGAKQAYVDATERAANTAQSQAPKAAGGLSEINPKATEESLSTADKFGSRASESTQAIRAHQAGQFSGSLKQAQAIISAHASGLPVDSELLRMANEVQGRAMGGIPGAGEGAYSNLQRELSGDRTLIGQPSFNEAAVAEPGGTVGGKPKNAGLLSGRSQSDVDHDIAIHGLGDLEQYNQPGVTVSAEDLRNPSISDSTAQQSLKDLALNSRFNQAQQSQYAPKSNIIGDALTGGLGGLGGALYGHGTGGAAAGAIGGAAKSVLSNPASRVQAAKFANSAVKSADPVARLIGEGLKRSIKNAVQNKADEVMASGNDPRRP